MERQHSQKKHTQSIRTAIADDLESAGCPHPHVAIEYFMYSVTQPSARELARRFGFSAPWIAQICERAEAILAAKHNDFRRTITALSACLVAIVESKYTSVKKVHFLINQSQKCDVGIHAVLNLASILMPHKPRLITVDDSLLRVSQGNGVYVIPLRSLTDSLRTHWTCVHERAVTEAIAYWPPSETRPSRNFKERFVALLNETIDIDIWQSGRGWKIVKHSTENILVRSLYRAFYQVVELNINDLATGIIRELSYEPLNLPKAGVLEFLQNTSLLSIRCDTAQLISPPKAKPTPSQLKVIAALKEAGHLDISSICQITRLVRKTAERATYGNPCVLPATTKGQWRLIDHEE